MLDGHVARHHGAWDHWAIDVTTSGTIVYTPTLM